MALRVGFIGLGNQGKPIAAHLAPAGFETTVFDLADEPVRELVAGGARAAKSPREVGERADVIGICVPADHHVRAVAYGADGLLAGVKPGAVIAIHSTILPSTVQAMNELAAAQGVEVVDACVSGNTRAADPMFKLYVGGEPAQVERISPYLSAIASDRVAV